MDDTITGFAHLDKIADEIGWEAGTRDADYAFQRAAAQMIYDLRNSLEAAKASVKARNKHIHTLMCEALENERNFDGMKSQWQTSEAQVARLTAERDWLAERCAEELGFSDSLFKERKATVDEWKEAARRAVADESGVNNDRN